MTTPPEDNEPKKSPPKVRVLYQSPDSSTLQPRKIRRQEIMWGVAISAGFLFFFVLGWVLSGSNEEEEANEQVATLFYQDAAQCEADLAQQQEAYLARQGQYQRGEITEQPAPPAMKPEDCAAQMEAAKQEHEKTAPVYQTLADCQAEGVQCEAATGNSTSNTNSGYRPIYGGTYIDPYYTPSYTYIYYGGIQHRVYEPRTVYLSSNPGRVVTPHGREISQTTVGRVTAPRHSTFSAPAKPTGTAAKGTIRGRSSQGFGSSFKSTGRGGK